MVATLDFILCHGYVYREDGAIDQILKDRLDYSLWLYQKGFATDIIVAGKYGQRDQTLYEATGISQSTKMKEYCLQQGIPANHIYEEPEGTNTFNCTKWAYERIICPKGWQAGVIVSSQEHLPRIVLQNLKIFPSDFHLFYSGPSICDPTEKEKFLAHEIEAVKYTLSRKN